MVPIEPTQDTADIIDPTCARQPVTLVKGLHKWTFACDPGDEPELLRRLSELASGPDTPFDWFDAALVTHQLNRRLKAGLHRIDGGAAMPTPPPHAA